MADETTINNVEPEEVSVNEPLSINEPPLVPDTDNTQPVSQELIEAIPTSELETINIPTKNNYFFILVLLILFIPSLFICIISTVNAKNVAVKSYLEAEKKSEESWKNTLYQKGLNRANNPVVTDVISVSVEEVRALSNMEVLQVQDVELVTHEKDKNGITAVLEVPGSGVFTVNYQLADFIVDQERNYVLVRIPYPELSECRVDYQNVVKLKFENNIFNDSIEVGEDVAKEMLENGDFKIEKEFISNPQFTERANEAAITVTESLIRDFNPDVEDLVVEVEFIEE